MKRKLGNVVINMNGEEKRIPLWGSIFLHGENYCVPEKDDEPFLLQGIYFNVSYKQFHIIFKENLHEFIFDDNFHFRHSENKGIWTTEGYKIKMWKPTDFVQKGEFQEVLNQLGQIEIDVIDGKNTYKVTFDIKKNWQFVKDNYLIEQI